jgi:uncharacterized protein YecE (DUF72 family)
MPRSAFSRYRVGCSGWQYRHWKGDFYPAELPQREWLEYYTRHFDTVEVNNSFYRLPEKGVFTTWRERSPGRFLFAVKASRFLTHMKKLKDPREPLERLFSRARELRTKLGPVLYQLPRQLPKNVKRLETFLSALPDTRRVKHTIEFREPSWYDEEVFNLLRRHNVALCLHDMPGSAAPRITTAKFVYIRFHGASGNYSGAYGRENLEGWADWLTQTGRPVFAYFNNDVGGHAPRDAAHLRALMAERQPVSGLATLVSSPGESKRPSADPLRRRAVRTPASGSRSPDRTFPDTAVPPSRP